MGEPKVSPWDEVAWAVLPRPQSRAITFFALCATVFRAEKRSAQASAHPLPQAQGGLFCVLTELTVFVCCWSSEWNANVCSLLSIFIWHICFFSSLENYFGFRTTNVKGKMDHSVSLKWNKRFWIFLKRRVFFLIVHWIKTRLFSVISSYGYFFTRPDLLPLQNQLYLCRQSKNHIAVITHQSEQTCALIKLSRK